MDKELQLEILQSNSLQDLHVVLDRDTKEVQDRKWCPGCRPGERTDWRGYPWQRSIHVRTRARGWKPCALYFSHAKPQQRVRYWREACGFWAAGCFIQFSSKVKESVNKSSRTKGSHPSKDVLNASSQSFMKTYLEERSQGGKKREQQLWSLVWRCTLPPLVLQCVFLLSWGLLHIHVPLRGRNHVSSTFFGYLHRPNWTT